jgi:hypothetical protein
MTRRRHAALSHAVVVALVIGGMASVWSVVADLRRISLVKDLRANPLGFDAARARAADHAVEAAAVVSGIAYLVTVVLFIVWLYRLYTDVQDLRPGRARYSSGWAIGGWFVPFLNWVRPKQVVDDVWRMSSPSQGWEADGGGLVRAWWLSFLAMNAATLISFGHGEATLSALEGHDDWDAISAVVSVASAVLAIMVVRYLTQRVAAMPTPVFAAAPFGLRFNPAPGWPPAPAGWSPPPGWQPDPAWPQAPPNWQFWI